MAIRPLFPDRIGICKCWFLWREENRSTRRKTLGAGTRTNNKLNPDMASTPGIEPGLLWWEASALTTAPSLLPLLPRCSPASFCFSNQRLRIAFKDLDPRLILSFAKLVMMSSAPAKSAWNARCTSQDPCIQFCPIQSRFQSVLGVRSFYVERNNYL